MGRSNRIRSRIEGLIEGGLLSGYNNVRDIGETWACRLKGIGEPRREMISGGFIDRPKFTTKWDIFHLNPNIHRSAFYTVNSLSLLRPFHDTCLVFAISTASVSQLFSHPIELS